MDRPHILRITEKDALPFVLRYAQEYGLPTQGAPSFGYDVAWWGAKIGETLHAVIGLLSVDEGIYVTGWYRSPGRSGLKAMAVLESWGYVLKKPLYGHVHKANQLMVDRKLEKDWQIIGETNTEFLMKYPRDILEPTQRAGVCSGMDCPSGGSRIRHLRRNRRKESTEGG